ncbi:MAG: nucleotide exchange factor GrpE [Anaerovoracaceae bacterium]
MKEKEKKIDDEMLKDVKDFMNVEGNDENEVFEEILKQSEKMKEKKETSTNEEKVKVAEKSETEQYQRLMADFQNYKRRHEKERSDIHAYANEKIITELMEVLDNFERAIDHDSEGHEKYREGIVMIFEQLKGVLNKAGVQEIDALGKEFDPNCHNAVMTENNKDFKSQQVCKVLQKGYTLKGKVIRPAMVAVTE